MGVYEKPAYRSGTQVVGDAIARATANGAISVVGGGDAAAAAHMLGFADEMTHVSTGGGATLEFLEGKTLPGVAALEDRRDAHDRRRQLEDAQDGGADRRLLRCVPAGHRVDAAARSRSSSPRRSRLCLKRRVTAARNARASRRADDALGTRRRVHRRGERADAAGVRRLARDSRTLRAARCIATKPIEPSTARCTRRSRKASRRSSPSARRTTSARPAVPTNASSRRRAPRSPAFRQRTLARVAIAYEPIWAIGTGRNCDPDEADRVMGRDSRLARRSRADADAVRRQHESRERRRVRVQSRTSTAAWSAARRSIRPASRRSIRQRGAMSYRPRRPRGARRLGLQRRSARQRDRRGRSAELARALRPLSVDTLEACGEAVGFPRHHGQQRGRPHQHRQRTRRPARPRRHRRGDRERRRSRETRRCALHRARRKRTGGTLHLMGLLSDGCVHSSLEHLFALIDAAVARRRADRDALLPRRPRHAAALGADVSSSASKRISPRPDAQGAIASVAGATTRWIATSAGSARSERTRRWPRRAPSTAPTAPREASTPPTRAAKTTSSSCRRSSATPRPIEDGDAVHLLQLSPRPRAPAHDRVRRRDRSVSPTTVRRLRTARVRDLIFATMTQYEEDYPNPVLFGPRPQHDTFGEIVARAGLTQLRLAETEKYAHVTYFFNGGREDVFAGEDRVLIPSDRTVADLRSRARDARRRDHRRRSRGDRRRRRTT